MLSNKEWLRINDIILIINSTESINAMRTYFLEAVKSLILFEKATFYLLEDSIDDVKLINPVFLNVDSSFASGYEMTFKEARYGRVAINTRRSIAYRDTDLMPEADSINKDMYKSFLYSNKVPYAGGIILTNKGILLAELTFFKSAEQGDFTDKEIYVLDILKEHLEIRLSREGSSAPSSSGDKALKLLESGLTTREVDVVKLVGEGLSTKEISDKLSISVFTAKKHINNIFSKLKINSRLQLIQFYTEI